MFEVRPHTPWPHLERRLVLIYLVLICLTLAHAVYYGYSQFAEVLLRATSGPDGVEFSKHHYTAVLSASHPIFAGKDFAPNQYRIGVVYLAKFVSDALHLTKYYSMYAVIDFFAALGACYCLYRVLVTSEFLLKRSGQVQFAVVALFLATLIFPFSWVVPWQRQETLPSALYIALAIFMLRLIKEKPIWLVALFFLTLWQDIVRTDVPVVLGGAVILLSFSAYGRRLFGSLKLGLISGSLLAGISAIAQYSLKHFVYPHAVYPSDTPAVAFFFNFNTARSLLNSSIALLPYFILLAVAYRHYKKLDSEDILILLASILYLPLWTVFGLLGEVRIFVPFLLALTPTAAKLIMIFLEGESPVLAGRADSEAYAASS